MANYIEFIGVPGVGKTSTYLTLRSGEKKDRWILYEELFGNGKTRAKNIKKSLENRFHVILNPKTLPLVERDAYLLQRFVQNNPELVDIFWKRLTKKDPAFQRDLRFYTANYISGIFERVESIVESTCTKFCLLDEGLIHNLSSFIPGHPEKRTYDEMTKILKLIELPKGVVYFDGEIETIVKRTLSRGNLRPKDTELSTEELIKSRKDLLKEKKITVQVLEAYKIPVLVVEAKDSLEKKSNQIKSFINSLELH